MKQSRVKPIGGAPTRRCANQECGEFFVLFDHAAKLCPDCEGEREEETPDVLDVIERRGRR